VAMQIAAETTADTDISVAVSWFALTRPASGKNLDESPHSNKVRGHLVGLGNASIGRRGFAGTEPVAVE
jgi:hypothetical protein